MKILVTLSLMITLLLGMSLPAIAIISETPDPTPFTDCDDPTVIAAYKNGIIKGYGNQTFHPLNTVSRAEWVQMLYNTFAITKTERPSDQPWYYPAAKWLGVKDDLSCPASYQWCIETIYGLWCATAEVEYQSADAVKWVTERGAGVNDNWRTVSNICDASGEYLSRIEAVHLLIRIGDPALLLVIS